LRKAAEGVETEKIIQQEKLTKKEMDSQLITVYKKLKAQTPIDALQALAKVKFTVVD
jgi:hypothetical protein